LMKIKKELFFFVGCFVNELIFFFQIVCWIQKRRTNWIWKPSHQKLTLQKKKNNDLFFNSKNGFFFVDLFNLILHFSILKYKTWTFHKKKMTFFFSTKRLKKKIKSQGHKQMSINFKLKSLLFFLFFFWFQKRKEKKTNIFEKSHQPQFSTSFPKNKNKQFIKTVFFLQSYSLFFF
jgi:hypothetical protein